MAKKERIKKILVEQILDKAKIPYESIVFAGGMNRDQAELDNYGLTDHDIYKTIPITGPVTYQWMPTWMKRSWQLFQATRRST